MQETIVLSVATVALVYLILKFVVKRKSHDCNKCDVAGNEKEIH